MSDLLIDSEFRALIPPLAPEEYAGLEQSLLSEGNRVPIDTWQGYIVDGHNRYDICQKHGIPLKPANEMPFKTREQALIWIIDNQLSRRNVPPAEKIRLAIIKHDIQFKNEARERITEHGKTAPGRMATPPQIYGGVSNHDSEVDTLIGKEAGVSRENVRKYRHIQEKAPEELKEKLRKGEATINQVYSNIKREEVRKSLKTTEWPTGKYRVLYADPPWQYDNHNPPNFGDQDKHYPTLSISDICKLPIQDICLDDAVLFLWVTSPVLEQSFDVLRAWGFQYKASFIWDKVKHVMGHFNSVRHEFLLVATKGNCQPEVMKLFDSVQVYEREGDHSHKPALFRDIINTLYPSGPRIELFATEQIDGWDYYGNQVSIS